MFTSRHSIVKFEMEQHQTLHTTSSHARVTFRLCSFARDSISSKTHDDHDYISPDLTK